MTNNDKERQPAVSTPQGDNKTWQAKRERALAAREMSQAMRQGKPKSFRRAVGKTA